MRKTLFYMLILFTNLFTVSSQDNYIQVKPERIFLHTDRNIYLAGEYLHYSMYLKGEADQTSMYAYLLVRDAANAVVVDARLKIVDKRSFGSIFLPDTLKTGYYQVACFSNIMRNSEDTFFTKEIVIANRFDEKLEQFTDSTGHNMALISDNPLSANLRNRQNLVIHPDRQVYNPRDIISFTVENMDQIAGLSVSVSEYVPGTPHAAVITDYFDTPEESFGESNITRGPCRFIPEFKSAVLQGRVTPVNKTGSSFNTVIYPVKNYTVLLSTVDSIPNLQFATTDSLGSFGFSLNPWYEGKEVIIKLKEEADATILVDSKTSLVKPFTPSEEFNIVGMKDYLLKCGKIAQVKRYFNRGEASDTIKLPVNVMTIPRVYNKHYITILPSDYIELPDFIEISREILPGLRVRRIKDTYISGYPNLQYKSDTDDEPAIFLDGIPIDGIDQIITLGTVDIRSIDIIPVIRYMGDMSFKGILAVESYNTEINSIRLRTPAVRYQVSGSQPFTKPESFRPESVPDSYPDLRKVLLWEPELIPSGSGKQIIECYASDLEGFYRIDVQGISLTGDPLAGSAFFKIQSR